MFFIEFIHWFIKLNRFPVYNSTTHQVQTVRHSSVAKSTFTLLCNHHHWTPQHSFICKTETLHHQTLTPSVPSPQLPVTTIQPPISMNLVIQGTSYTPLHSCVSHSERPQPDLLSSHAHIPPSPSISCLRERHQHPPTS